MQRIPRSLRAVLAGALLIALAAVPAHAADPEKAQLPDRPSATVSTTAKILIETNVFAQPGKHIKLRLPTHAAWGGGPHVLLVLDSRMYKGKAWLRVALPIARTARAAGSARTSSASARRRGASPSTARRTPSPSIATGASSAASWP